MKKLKCFLVEDKNQEIAELKVGDNFFSRLQGLMFSKSLAEGTGLLLEPAKQVHSFFMNYAIRVIFLDDKNVVVGSEYLKPWRISKLYLKAKKVIEINESKEVAEKIKPGQSLSLIEVSDA